MNNPFNVTETINANTALQIDCQQALELAVNQIFAKYAYIMDNGQAENVVADITGVEFEMVRMKEKDTKDYISVPAWKFYGEVRMKRSKAELDYLKKCVAEGRGTTV